MIRIAVITFGVLLSFTANALTVKMEAYLHPKDHTDHVFDQLYLDGVVRGLIIYNTAASDKLFCLPPNLNLATDQADSILKNWAKKQTKNTNDLPIEIALLGGLEETFPCP